MVEQDSKSLIASMTSNRSPSPLSSRNCRNSEAYSTTRRSFNGNPFARPTAPIDPKSSKPYTPANTPTAIDHTRRNSINRKSIDSMFQDGKENHRDAIRSPARIASRNFMAPTISAASKFTPSPRKKILGEKNDVTRTSIQFLDKDSVFDHKDSKESRVVEQKESVLENPFLQEVNLSLKNDEQLSDVVEDSDFVKMRPLCCSPIASPIVAAADSDPHLPPYDPNKNFLSPRPQFLRYKPNPRIEVLLNKEGDDDHGECDVTRLEESFNLSENSAEIKVEEHEKEAELGDDSVHGSLKDSSEMVSEEKPFDLKVEKASKQRFFTVSKTVSIIVVLFLVACFSLSFTESPPMDLPIYEDVGFSDIYHESLRFAAFAKESFDDVVETIKQWSMDLVSYKSRPVQFFNLTTSPIQEEFQFNRHIGTDYTQQVQELDEETERIEEEEEEDFEEMEVDDESDVLDEVVTEEPNHKQIQSDLDDLQETKSNLGEGFVSESEAVYEAKSEVVENDVEMESSFADSNGESEALSALSTQSITTVCVAGLFMVTLAVSSVLYMNQKKSNASNSGTTRVYNDNTRRESCSSVTSGNVHKGYKKKTCSNRRESLASSSSDLSMGSPSYGSFTTFERIAVKHKDEVMLTSIRRSSRLVKNHDICS